MNLEIDKWYAERWSKKWVYSWEVIVVLNWDKERENHLGIVCTYATLRLLSPTVRNNGIVVEGVVRSRGRPEET